MFTYKHVLIFACASLLSVSLCSSQDKPSKDLWNQHGLPITNKVLSPEKRESIMTRARGLSDQIPSTIKTDIIHGAKAGLIGLAAEEITTLCMPNNREMALFVGFTMGTTLVGSSLTSKACDTHEVSLKSGITQVTAMTLAYLGPWTVINALLQR